MATVVTAEAREAAMRYYGRPVVAPVLHKEPADGRVRTLAPAEAMARAMALSERGSLTGYIEWNNPDGTRLATSTRTGIRYIVSDWDPESGMYRVARLDTSAEIRRMIHLRRCRHCGRWYAAPTKCMIPYTYRHYGTPDGVAVCRSCVETRGIPEETRVTGPLYRMAAAAASVTLALQLLPISHI